MRKKIKRCVLHLFVCAVSYIDNSALRLRYQASQKLSVVHELGFRPACKVKTGTFDPRTVFGRPGIPPPSLLTPFSIFTFILFSLVFTFFRLNYDFFLSSSAEESENIFLVCNSFQNISISKTSGKPVGFA